MTREAEALQEEGNVEELLALTQQMSTAFCTTADLYLTDLWYAFLKFTFNRLLTVASQRSRGC